MHLSQYSDFIRAQDRAELKLKLSWSSAAQGWHLFAPSGKLLGTYTQADAAQEAYFLACQEVEALRAFGLAR